MLDNNDRLSKAAREIMNYSRGMLTVNLCFLAGAIRALDFCEYDETIYTDGRTIYYNPKYVAAMYKLDKALPVRCFLHLLIHCIFRHNLIDAEVDARCWDLACDIAAENVINDLAVKCAHISRAAEQKRYTQQLVAFAPRLTAENLYKWLKEGSLAEDKLTEMEKLFQIDDHTHWYDQENPEDKPQAGGAAENGEEGKAKGSGKEVSGEIEGGNFGESEQRRRGKACCKPNAALRKTWEDISRNIRTDLETFSKNWGDSAGQMMMNLNSVNREKYDYTDFLKRFAVAAEAMKINDDEFDYIFYTYGMEHYERMPFIEPLEYKEVKRVRDFVIALDTSGSVSGIVKQFVQKTYNILMQEDSFFSRINLHIIQCDSEIHEDVKITTREELEAYITNMTIKGFGGTDFRPIFSRVDELVKNGEMKNLKGVILFTDGYGEFPRKQPDYQTAIVYLDNDFNNPEVPPWAIKVVLNNEEIENI